MYRSKKSNEQQSERRIKIPPSLLSEFVILYNPTTNKNQAVRLIHLKFNYGQLRQRLFSPAGNKAPPLHFSLSTYPHIVSGLARSLFRLPHIHPAVVFFLSHFLQYPLPKRAGGCKKDIRHGDLSRLHRDHHHRT